MAAGFSAQSEEGASPVATWQFNPTATAISRVRRDLRGLLQRHGVPEDPADAVLLVAYELIANAAEHARTVAELSVVLDGANVHVEVRDGSPAPPQQQPLDTDAVRGRGLQVVDELATHWSWAPEGPGKAVWADVPIDRYPDATSAAPAAG